MESLKNEVKKRNSKRNLLNADYMFNYASGINLIVIDDKNITDCFFVLSEPIQCFINGEACDLPKSFFDNDRLISKNNFLERFLGLNIINWKKIYDPIDLRTVNIIWALIIEFGGQGKYYKFSGLNAFPDEFGELLELMGIDSYALSN